jgi:hypothetical protein
MILQSLVLFGAAPFLLIPAVIVSGYACLAIFTCVLDNKSGLAALTESYAIIKGRWWKTFGRLLFLGLLYAVVSIVIFGVVSGLRFLLGIPEGSMAGAILVYLANLGIISAMGPISLTYSYRLYESLKATRAVDVTTDGFKMWLVVFLVMSILGLAVAIVGVTGFTVSPPAAVSLLP